jgi:broad specificity phosphatase PhoE
MTHIFIVQHAEKEHGPGDPGLTERGAVQAGAVARFMAHLGPLSHVVSSPYRRALETARIIGQFLGLVVQEDDRLQERMNWAADKTGQSPEQFLGEWAASTADRDFLPTSGDSSRVAGLRFEEALREHAGTLPAEGRFVAVAHGGVTVDLLRNLLDDEALDEHNPGLIAGGVPSCGITYLTLDRGRFGVIRVGDTSHLVPELRLDHRVV